MSPGRANETGAELNEAVVFETLIGILGAGVVSNRDESARDGNPQNADEPVTDPSVQDPLSLLGQEVVGGTAVAFEGRGNAPAESMHRSARLTALRSSRGRPFRKYSS